MANTPRSMSAVSRSTNQEPPSGSATEVTLVSSAITCWVRSASRIASSVGMAKASSMPLACRLWQPPSTAASAWKAVRIRFTRCCGRVSVAAAVCAWKRSRIDSGFRAPNRSFMTLAYTRRSARNFATSSNRSACATKKNERRGANSSTCSPAAVTSST